MSEKRSNICQHIRELFFFTLPSMKNSKFIATVLCNIDSSFFACLFLLFSPICFFFCSCFFFVVLRRSQNEIRDRKRIRNNHKEENWRTHTKKQANKQNKRQQQQQQENLNIKRQKTTKRNKSKFASYSPTVRKRWRFKE